MSSKWAILASAVAVSLESFSIFFLIASIVRAYEEGGFWPAWKKSGCKFQNWPKNRYQFQFDIFWMDCEFSKHNIRFKICFLQCGYDSPVRVGAGKWPPNIPTHTPPHTPHTLPTYSPTAMSALARHAPPDCWRFSSERSKCPIFWWIAFKLFLKKASNKTKSVILWLHVKKGFSTVNNFVHKSK